MAFHLIDNNESPCYIDKHKDVGIKYSPRSLMRELRRTAQNEWCLAVFSPAPVVGGRGCPQGSKCRWLIIRCKKQQKQPGTPACRCRASLVGRQMKLDPWRH